MPPKKKVAAAEASPAEDVSMAEVPTEDFEEAVEEPDADPSILNDDEPRIRVVGLPPRRFTRYRLTCGKLAGSTDTAASYEFAKEDHTLGNALRYIIMKKYVTIYRPYIPISNLSLFLK